MNDKTKPIEIVNSSIRTNVSPVSDDTIRFDMLGSRDNEMKRILKDVYRALEEKGYNPISQLVGYILSEDPTYITTHNNARSLIRKIDRDELLQSMVRYYIK